MTTCLGKSSSIRFTMRLPCVSFINVLSVCESAFFPFGFKDGMGDVRLYMVFIFLNLFDLLEFLVMLMTLILVIRF